jgi:hypothetical protein
MWPRISEAAVGAWLIASTYLLAPAGLSERTVVPLLAGMLVILIGLASRRHHLLHLLVLAVAAGLIGWGWLRYPRPGPAAAQNAILAGLVLGLLAIVPSDAHEPPPGWKPHVRDDSPG